MAQVFALMGSVFAIRERRPLVPNTPTSQNELVAELRDLAVQLDVEGKLRRYGSALTIPEDPRAEGAHYFLLELQPQGTTLRITTFRRQQLELATSRYNEAEKDMHEKHKGGQAVLVSVDSLRRLRRAYPNYYLDTRDFLKAMQRAIS